MTRTSHCRSHARRGRERHRYDLTTDAALAQRAGPRLAAYKGVLIVGNARWLTPRVRESLKRYARGGGTVVSLGTDALRRTVQLKDGRLSAPSKNRVTDLFGAQIRPVVRDPTRLQLFKDNPRLTLFEGSDGSFDTVDAYEQTIGLGEGKLLSSAVTVEPANRTVIVAARLGKGRVIRTGMPSFEVRVATDEDPALTALMERLWVLLSR